jgi:Pentapeptide repeats (8 copies)
VPGTDKNGESVQTQDGPPATQWPGHTWLPSLWLWPGAAIALAGIAGALFGTTGALLVGGLALATLVLTAGILTLRRDRRLAIATATPLIAALALLVGLGWATEFQQPVSRPTPATARAGVAAKPHSWQWLTISQVMASRASFAGADLDNANLDGLQLSHKNFDGAEANGASFRGSQLEDASLRGASLRGACLEGANLTGADLTGADFTGADVAGVMVLLKAKKAALVWPRAGTRTAAVCQ